MKKFTDPESQRLINDILTSDVRWPSGSSDYAVWWHDLLRLSVYSDSPPLEAYPRCSTIIITEEDRVLWID